MSKHIRKILPLLLCLLLMACLLPAAYAADEVNVNFSTPEELQNAISAHNQLLAQDSSARTSASASGDFTITGELTLPKGFRLRTDYKLTIAANAVVTVNGKLDAKGGGYIDILGKVINYGQVRMFDTGVIHVAGTLENRSQIEYEDVSPDIKHLVIDQKENLQIYGPINVYAGVSPTESVLGVNVDNWCRSIPKDNPDVSIYIPLFGIQLEDKSSSGRYSYIEVRGTEAYTLTKDMTVPAGTEVVMNNIVLTVPDGKTAVVNGFMQANELVIEQGATVKLNQGGELRSAGSMTISDGCNIIVDNAWIHGGYSDGVSLNALKTASFTGDAGIHLYFNFDKPEKVQSTLKKAADAAAANVGHIDSVVYARYNWTITDDLTLPERVQVEVRVGRDGGIVINEGATLTIPESSTLLVAGTDLRLNGTLANNGTVLLGADVVPGSKGIYCGSGSVEYMGQPYAIYNSKSAADMILPEALTALESQALADGVFTSVYIPAGIQSIASDAFGNKTGLIILAEPGSKGAEFAAAKNYLFAPVAPAA